MLATTVSVVVVAAVVTVAVARPVDEPQHPLRVAEEPPDLADVHVRLALFPTASDTQSYEAAREKFRPASGPSEPAQRNPDEEARLRVQAPTCVREVTRAWPHGERGSAQSVSSRHSSVEVFTGPTPGGGFGGQVHLETGEV